MVRSALGVPVTVVHYKSGSETVAAILGGQIDLASEAPVGVLGHVRGGKLRGIAVCDDKRVPVLADIPTTVEQGFATIQMQHWGGVFAPKGTPAAILDRIAQAMQKAFATDAGLRAQMEANGLRTTVGSRADFDAFLSNEKARLGEIVNATGMTLE
jgi:tripartite-type tricarboxylate transporter receptor subunit TctC